MSPAGIVTFTLLTGIDNTSDPLPLNFGNFITAKDGDGDLITLPAGAVVFNVEDGDGPAVLTTATISVDEEGLETVNALGTAETPTIGSEDSTAERGTGTVSFQAGTDNITSIVVRRPVAASPET